MIISSEWDERQESGKWIKRTVIAQREWIMSVNNRQIVASTTPEKISKHTRHSNSSSNIKKGTAKCNESIEINEYQNKKSRERKDAFCSVLFRMGHWMMRNRAKAYETNWKLFSLPNIVCCVLCSATRNWMKRYLVWLNPLPVWVCVCVWQTRAWMCLSLSFSYYKVLCNQN